MHRLEDSGFLAEITLNVIVVYVACLEYSGVMLFDYSLHIVHTTVADLAVVPIEDWS